MLQVRARIGAMAECSRGDPKLAKLVDVLEAHFERAAAQGLRESRAMVFTSKRNGVEIICELTGRLASGLIRARCATSGYGRLCAPA